MAFKGIVILGPQSMGDPLGAIMKAYDIIAQETGGKLVFIPRDTLDEITIEADDIAAHSPGEEVPRKVTITDTKNISLPKEVNVEHIEPLNDYQAGSQRERRINVNTDHVETLRLPVVLSADEARGIAMRELWTTWANKQRIHLSLPPKYLHILENDIINVPVGSESFRTLITKLEKGRSGLMLIEGDIEVFETRNFNPSNNDPGASSSSVAHPSMLLFSMFDIPPLGSAHIYQVGVYAAACNWLTSAAPIGGGAATRWRGGKYYHSIDDVTFNEIESADLEGILGVAETVLPGEPYYYWDRENTLDVEIFNGELLSVEEIDVMNGVNWALLGKEIIGFKTATLLDTRRYRLSTLLRGLRNTESKTGDHVAGDIFIPLSGTLFQFIPLSPTLIGGTQYYKAASEGIDLANVDSQSFVLEGNTVIPFSPGALKASRNASNDVTFTWVRRTRTPTSLLSPIRTPLEEPFERYEIDYFDNGNVVRTVVIEDATTTIYTAAQQTTDGLTPGDPVHFKLYQIGATVGRGRVADATL